MDAPSAVAALASRDLGSLDLDLVTATDPVLAVKRDHPDAGSNSHAKNRRRVLPAGPDDRRRKEQITQVASGSSDPTLAGVVPRLSVVDGDEAEVGDRWADAATEALLVAHGIGKQLSEPQAKLIPLPIDGLIRQAAEAYDKIFVVHIDGQLPGTVKTVELDTLMQHTGR